MISYLKIFPNNGSEIAEFWSVVGLTAILQKEKLNFSLIL